MFNYCQIRKENCPFAAKSKGNLYCGAAYGENRMSKLEVCPLEGKRSGARRQKSK